MKRNNTSLENIRESKIKLDFHREENMALFDLYVGDPVVIKDETIWYTQKAMADLFGIDKSGISRHISNIFSSLAKN